MLNPDFINDLLKLLSIPSTNDSPKMLNDVLEYAIDLAGDGLTCERFESNGKPSALLYLPKKRPSRFRLLLNAHLDVVDAPKELFKPKIVGNQLYARGALDMKSAALAMIYAFRENAAHVNYDLGLQLVCDEEEAGHDGTEHQVTHGKVRTESVLIGEFTNLKLTMAGKGLARVILKSKGESSHGAYPWNGTNAIDELMAVLQKIKLDYPNLSKPAWRTTVSCSNVFTNNNAINIIPDEAEAWLDVRPVASDPNFSNYNRLLKWLRRVCGANTEFQVFSFSPGTDPPLEGNDLDLLKSNIIKEGIKPQSITKHGTSDARFFKNTKILYFGPAGEGAHSQNEYVELDSVEKYLNILNRFIKTLV